MTLWYHLTSTYAPRLRAAKDTPRPTAWQETLAVADPRVTIVGATGAVGKVALAVLEERAFPMERLRLTASPRSVGKKCAVQG